jgi:hypothetical protein
MCPYLLYMFVHTHNLVSNEKSLLSKIGRYLLGGYRTVQMSLFVCLGGYYGFGPFDCFGCVFEAFYFLDSLLGTLCFLFGYGSYSLFAGNLSK